MARDRKRAKERRQRRPDPPPATELTSPAPETDAPEGVASEGATRTPHPLEHGSADVDRAGFAEKAGGEPARPPERGEADPATFEAPHPAARQRGRVLTFLGHVVDELKRVQWPDRRHVAQATAVVLGFVVLAGGYLGLLDAVWKPLVDALL